VTRRHCWRPIAASDDRLSVPLMDNFSYDSYSMETTGKVYLKANPLTTWWLVAPISGQDLDGCWASTGDDLTG